MEEIKKNKYCVYFHLSKSTNQIFYVGFGLNKRPYDIGSRSKGWNKITNFGKEFTVEIFENRFDLNMQEALDWEKYFIKKYGRYGMDCLGILVNRSVGGLGGATGSTHKQSPQLKEKILKAKLGKKFSPEVRKNMSEGQKGKIFSDEHKENISKSKKGYKYDIERDQKISKALKGKIRPKLSKPVLQFTLDGEFIKEWKSVSEAKLKFNNNKGDGIGQCCRGNIKQSLGFIWKFKSDKNEEKNT